MVDCNSCFKFHNSVISGDCRLCQDYAFEESILCDLLRSEKGDRVHMDCFAFKPDLAAVGETKQISDAARDSDKKTELSNRQKWLKAYALQQWKFDSDRIFVNLNFHVCLLTMRREKLFGKATGILAEASSIFSDAGALFNGKVSFLCAGLDHIHLHIDAPPDYSADEVVRKIIAFSESALRNDNQKLSDRKEIFGEAYFIETIG